MKTLVVEDDPVTRRLLGQLLKLRRHDVTSCGTAEQAIEHCTQEFFPLIILDLFLPKLNGFDFCRWLRTQPRGDCSYVLVSTAGNSPQDLHEILGAGADDYIAKPYQKDLLNVRLEIAEAQVQALTVRKRLEADLEREKDFISAVVETAPALIVVVDRSGLILRANHACLQLTGYNEMALLGQPFVETLIAENRQAEAHAEMERLLKHHQRINFESPLRVSPATAEANGAVAEVHGDNASNNSVPPAPNPDAADRRFTLASASQLPLLAALNKTPLSAADLPETRPAAHILLEEDGSDVAFMDRTEVTTPELESIPDPVAASLDARGLMAPSLIDHEVVVAWSAAAVAARESEEQTFFICAGVDITDRCRMEERLLYLATRDPLTGLQNRGSLTASIEAAVLAAQRGHPGALLYLDLDNFKIVNDTAGHTAGDRLLVQMAEVLRQATREGDGIVRFGGDEFVVILRDISLEEATVLAERLRSRLDEFVFYDNGRSFAVGASIGLTAVDGRFSAEQVMAQADSACYAAKTRGRHRVELYRMDDTEFAQLRSDTNWLPRIKAALKNELFDLYFQPIQHIASGEIRYYEALLRLREADGRLIQPTAFLPAAARFQLTHDIDRCVMAKAIAHLQANPKLILSINLSGQSLSDPHVLKLMEWAISQAEEVSRRIILEITETEVVANLSAARSVIGKLRDQGFRFALDDFGSGFSSFTYLKNLPVNYLKIDGSFVRDLAQEPANQAFLRAMHDVAHHLGIQTIAEWVRDAETYEILRKIGFNYAQGYYIGEPEPRALGQALPNGIGAHA